MGKETPDLAPWEIPPDEAYWRALLQEGEYGQPRQENQTASASEAVDFDGNTRCARHEDEQPSSPWNLVRQYWREERSVTLEVVGYNRGGVLVNWNGLTGFIPASQLCADIASDDEQARRTALAACVGQTFELKVIEANAEKRRLILSERGVSSALAHDAHLLDELAEGDVCSGTVTNLCSFGAFVDLGGIEGLIHISELSWGRVAEPSEVVQGGDEIQVYVLKVDRERGRVGLSLKRLYPDPWDTVETRYGIGQVVEGLITNVVNFGAFVRIESGLEGLIHTSDWNCPLALDPSREGDMVHVRVMNVDRERRRMGLRLEYLVENSEAID
jgi:small subunit ribosomal protein S1